MNIKILKAKLSREFKLRKQLLSYILLAVAIFSISFSIHFLISEWFIDFNEGMPAYDHPSGPLWEAVSDGEFIYPEYVYAFRFENWDIYDSSYDFPLDVYYYGPFFVYVLTFISLFIGLFNPSLSNTEISYNTVFFSSHLFDALNSVMIFLILIKIKNDGEIKRRRILLSSFLAICYNLMPMVLFYNGIMGLNSYMFTFFTLLSLYFYCERKTVLSSVTLALSFLTKQTSLFFLPVWFLILARNDLKESIKYLVTFLIAYIYLSIPWIFMHPAYYNGVLFAQGYSGIVDLSLDYLRPANLFHSLFYLGATKLATGYYWLNKFYIPFIIFSLVFYRISLLKGDLLNKDFSSFFSFNAIYIIGIHVFLSRGIYKNYYPFLFPFILIAISEWVLNMEKNWKIILVSLTAVIWLVGVNILIIWLIKWLHPLLILLFWLPLFFTYNKDMHLALFKKENYIKTRSYFSSLLQS